MCSKQPRPLRFLIEGQRGAARLYQSLFYRVINTTIGRATYRQLTEGRVYLGLTVVGDKSPSASWWGGDEDGRQQQVDRMMLEQQLRAHIPAHKQEAECTLGMVAEF